MFNLVAVRRGRGMCPEAREPSKAAGTFPPTERMTVFGAQESQVVVEAPSVKPHGAIAR